MERRRNKEERELVSKLRMFARFHSPSDHEALVNGLLKARQLKKQIEIYQNYRKLGIRTLEEARKYEVDRKKRENEQSSSKMKEITPYLFETGRNNYNKANNNNRNNRLNNRLSRGNNSNSNLSEEDDNSQPLISSLNLPDATLTLIDVANAPCAEYLSDLEMELCQKVPMLPSHYLAAKDAIIR